MEPAERVQDALAEREIFTSGPVVVFRWTNAPGWPVEYASKNVLDVFGYSTAQFVQGEVAYSELIHGDDLQRVSSEVQVACEGEGDDFTHRPYRVCRADGRVIWLYDHTNLIRDSLGEITHFLGYVVDITSQVEAEQANQRLQQQLLHAQKLESLGLLAGGLAHDFNNVLTGILGYATLAQRALQKSSPALAADALGEVESISIQAAKLCQQLLAYSGRGKFVVEPLDLSQTVLELKGMLQVTISKKAQLQLDLPAGLSAVVGDKAQIQQVVMNLVSNASEALEGAAGEVSVALAERELGAADLADLVAGSTPLGAGRYLVLSVSDTGIGMSEGVRARLFDPFFTTKFTGRGLGLAAALGIVRGHQGGIRIETTPGQGSRFELIFPPSELPLGDDPRLESPVVLEGSGEGRVLLVDDEQVVRRVGRGLLEVLGYEVEVAEDGAAALERLREREAPAFVVLDLTMPVLSGRETLRELRKLHPTLPVILSSGFNEEEAVDPESGSGLLEFLQKPYRLEDLATAIGRLKARRA